MVMKLLSFCSGCGALDYGINKHINAEVVLKCELDKTIRETITYHHPDIVIKDDIMQLSVESIQKDCKLSDKDELICIGGTPCPSFSVAGKRKSLDDPRGACLPKFLNLSIGLNAKYIVLENVRGLLSAKVQGQESGSVMKMVVQPLEQAGYKVSYQLYDAKYFGAGTSRNRVILMAVKDNKALPFLKPTHGINDIPFVTLGNVLSTLPKDLKHHHTQFTAKRLPFFKMLKAGQHWRHLPEDQIPLAVTPGTLKTALDGRGGQTGLYRRLWWDRPCPTLLCTPTMNTTSLCHPGEDRPLSVEEYKVIQGYPLDYVIKGSIAKQYKQLGNCVPVKLSEAIGKVIKNHMESGKLFDPVYEYVRCSRYKYKNYYTN